LVYLYEILWLRLEKIRKKLRRQGIDGPRPTLLYGNTQEMKRIRQELKCVHRQQDQDMNNGYISTIFPHFILWRKTYDSCLRKDIHKHFVFKWTQILRMGILVYGGSVLYTWPVFLYSTGVLEILHVAQPEMVKDLGRHWIPSELGKPRHKKIHAPQFFVEKIKGMIGLIVDATVPLLQSWEDMLDSTGGSSQEIYLVNFGSNFVEGKEIFCKLRQLQKLISQQDTLVGLSALWKYWPTKRNWEIQKLDQQVRLLILDLSREHRSSRNRSNGGGTHNLLHAINIYFAGHETAAVTATWCLMLLAAHPDWQERARAEALEVCCGQTTLTMVIQETLRLYPPASLIMREALTDDIRLGGVDVPHGTIIQVAISMLHLDMEAWGPDANEFRPDRFANGAAAACKPAHMYMPFGYGPRLCTGQNLAMAELKVVLACLLSKFSSLSPGYQHSPVFRLTIGPEFGKPLVVTRLP
uniref:Cytochrome P450 n=1 Tax=Setaria italica TaxID=4555 RepID=K3Y2T8_SETIT